jgi:NTP pyrophosphatase (non-canonical NTP hydrolase)
MTEINTTSPVSVSGKMPTARMASLPVAPDGVKTKVLKEVEIDLAESGYCIVPIGTSIPELQRIIHEWAIRKEWRGPKAETQRTTGDDIALIVSEAAEALEAFRESNEPRATWYSYTLEVEGIKFKNLSLPQVCVLLECETDEVHVLLSEAGVEGKPEGVPSELADLIIRVLDYSEEHGINLLHHIIEKMAYNDTREVRHGGMHL